VVASADGVTVTFNNLLPKVTSVTPYVATAGTTLEVILRGSGFSQVGNTAIKFGSGGSVTSYNVVNDTEIHVTHPSLTADTYRVSFANQLGAPNVVRSSANARRMNPKSL